MNITVYYYIRYGYRYLFYANKVSVMLILCMYMITTYLVTFDNYFTPKYGER